MYPLLKTGLATRYGQLSLAGSATNGTRHNDRTNCVEDITLMTAQDPDDSCLVYSGSTTPPRHSDGTSLDTPDGTREGVSCPRRSAVTSNSSADASTCSAPCRYTT